MVDGLLAKLGNGLVSRFRSSLPATGFPVLSRTGFLCCLRAWGPNSKHGPGGKQQPTNNAARSKRQASNKSNAQTGTLEAATPTESAEHNTQHEQPEQNHPQTPYRTAPTQLAPTASPDATPHTSQLPTAQAAPAHHKATGHGVQTRNPPSQRSDACLSLFLLSSFLFPGSGTVCAKDGFVFVVARTAPVFVSYLSFTCAPFSVVTRREVLLE